MKNGMVAVSLLCLLGGTAQAAQNGLRVPYSASIPASIRSYRPRGAQTRFFGTRRIESLHTDLFLHLYQAKQRSSGRRNPDVLPPPYCLDIFTRGTERSTSRRLTRVQHIRVQSEAGDNSFGVDLMWLDTKQQKMPVLKLNVFNSGNFYGPTNAFKLFVFSGGFDHKPTMQTFAEYGDHNEIMSFRFDKVDERGLMVVTQIYQQSGDRPDEIKTLRWDGKQFVAAQVQMGGKG